MIEAHKFRALIVNNDEMFRFKLMDVLQYENCIEVVGDYPSAEGALAEMENLNPDIIVLDTELPGINGIDACRKFLKNDYYCDIIMFGTELQNVNKAMKAGASWYFPKDIEPHKLAAVFQMTCKWQCMKSCMEERCNPLTEIASMITEHLTESNKDKTDNPKKVTQIESVELSEETGDSLKEVTIKIITPHAAPQLLRFYRQIEENLQSGIVETIGSSSGTCIRLNLQKPFSLPVILDVIDGMPEVESVQEVSDNNEVSLSLCDKPVIRVNEAEPVKQEQPTEQSREMAGVTNR